MDRDKGFYWVRPLMRDGRSVGDWDIMWFQGPYWLAIESTEKVPEELLGMIGPRVLPPGTATS